MSHPTAYDRAVHRSTAAKRHRSGRPSATALAVGCTAFAWLVLTGGCGDPCRDLSDAVCNCMPSRMEQQACRKRVHNLAAQSPSNTGHEQQICHDLLQTCSCDALSRGDFSACGLAQD